MCVAVSGAYKSANAERAPARTHTHTHMAGAIGHLYALPAQALTPGHRLALTVKPDVPQMWSSGEPEEFEVSRTTARPPRVPRHYGLRHFGRPRTRGTRAPARAGRATASRAS